jgi:hypothetical protein
MGFLAFIKKLWKIWNLFKGNGLTKEDKKDIKDWSSVALKLVRDADRTSLINEAKKNEAFKLLKEAALSKGVVMDENKLNFLVERAVLIMKNMNKV